jgi:hypothetical protein
MLLHCRQEFISWFCDKQLSEYRRVFAKGEEVHQMLASRFLCTDSFFFFFFSLSTQSYLLIYADRRFAWLKKALTKFDEDVGKVFPKHWKMDEMIAKEFCVLTRYISFFCCKNLLPMSTFFLIASGWHSQAYWKKRKTKWKCRHWLER